MRRANILIIGGFLFLLVFSNYLLIPPTRPKIVLPSTQISLDQEGVQEVIARFRHPGGFLVLVLLVSSHHPSDGGWHPRAERAHKLEVQREGSREISEASGELQELKWGSVSGVEEQYGNRTSGCIALDDRWSNPMDEVHRTVDVRSPSDERLVLVARGPHAK